MKRHVVRFLVDMSMLAGAFALGWQVSSLAACGAVTAVSLFGMFCYWDGLDRGLSIFKGLR